MCLFLRIAPVETLAKNSPENIARRFTFAKHVLKFDIDYCKNCVFISEIVLQIDINQRDALVLKSLTTKTENRTLGCS